MFFVLTFEARWLHAVAAVALLAAATPGKPLLAQGLDDTQAVETIIDSDVSLEESRAEDEAEAVMAALANSAAGAAQVRKTFNLDAVEIVFVPGIEEADSEVGRMIEERSDEIAELRQAIEGNAMLYHAVNSRSILLDDIVALEFDDEDGVKIYAAAEAPSE